MSKWLNYETSAYELACDIPKGMKDWSRKDYFDELEARIKTEKERREIHVYYYRIGYTMAFELPVSQNIKEMPAGIPTMTAAYPWNTWLSWALRERWEVLYYAWRHKNDEEAGMLLQRETAALADWDYFAYVPGNAELHTGHFADCLSRFLCDSSGWDEKLYAKALTAASNLIEKNIWPWFQRIWQPKGQLKRDDLHNIPCISLIAAAHLAALTKSPHVNELESKARNVADAWNRFRLDDPPHTEGAAYDGFLLDTLTFWLESLPDFDKLITIYQNAFRDVFTCWLHLVLPGRTDIFAPIGDVEPEMPFWMTVNCRFAEWYGWEDSVWLAKRLPPIRLPAVGLIQMIGNSIASMSASEASDKEDKYAPCAGAIKHAYTISMRTGWESEDCLAALGLARNKVGHLHNDSGHIVIGCHNRFWITDPGYQQYLQGQERDYTLGIEAHNTPVINGIAQSAHKGRLLALETNRHGQQHASLDITSCYEGIQGLQLVQRDVWLEAQESKLIVVCDKFILEEGRAKVDYFWQVGTHLGWSFRDGFARLSDEKHALWISTYPGRISPSDLFRHPGSRGPLTLHRDYTLQSGSNSLWWVFSFDSVEATVPSAEKLAEKLILPAFL